MIEVSFKHMYFGGTDGARQRARKVWQVLFDMFRSKGGDVSNMNDILCDYDWLTGFFCDL